MCQWELSTYWDPSPGLSVRLPLSMLLNHTKKWLFEPAHDAAELPQPAMI